MPGRRVRVLQVAYQTHTGHGHTIISAGINHQLAPPGNLLALSRCSVKTVAATTLPTPSHSSAIPTTNVMAYRFFRAAGFEVDIEGNPIGDISPFPKY